MLVYIELIFLDFLIQCDKNTTLKAIKMEEERKINYIILYYYSTLFEEDRKLKKN